jgi:NAD(P)-dependent dehydrogenase (short-subunit alcohol dehydrogenase family)
MVIIPLPLSDPEYAMTVQPMSSPSTPTLLELRSLPGPFKALVLGASGTIGKAFIETLSQMPSCRQVVGLHRSSSPAIDLESEETLRHAAQSLTDQGPFQLILDATGALTIDGIGPEKSLSQCKPQVLAKSFAINAIGRALVLKHFTPLLPRHGRSLFGVLSARVGSIEDNRLGGWYGYRASKAAGNMVLQNAAIEIHRTKPEVVFAALQPGTVASNLSAPFNKGHDLVEPADAARGLLLALDRLHAKGSAWFVDYRGDEIPW